MKCNCECHINNSLKHVKPCCCKHKYSSFCPECDEEFDKLVRPPSLSKRKCSYCHGTGEVFVSNSAASLADCPDFMPCSNCD